jgi:hypothetical protein
VIDSIDLSNHEVGDVIELPHRKARLLVAEGWGMEERRLGGVARVLAFRRETDLGHHFEEERRLRSVRRG